MIRLRETRKRRHFDARRSKFGTAAPETFLSKKVTAKINEIEGWIEEVKKLKVNKNTDIEKEELVLLLRTMFKELIQEAVSDETTRITGHKIHEVIQQKKKEVIELRKGDRKRQKQLNREIDLKHYEGSAADKLLDLVRERKKENKEPVTTLLDRLWRKEMNGGILIGKDFEAIEAAKTFLREVQLKTS